MAVIMGNQYSLAAQVRLGNVSNELDSNLQADCFTGTWVASSVLQDRENAQFVLSPGDLDEAVTAFLAFADTPEEAESGTGGNGTAFQPSSPSATASSTASRSARPIYRESSGTSS